ncbi:MAG: hydrogenase maturation nickel metallochaperone HypA [Rhodoplanes sp.]|nr:hydrogenase maturation nickel metallochaperone HypA [Rhodoplanes sp.]
MHEMSLTESLVELIENEREKQGFSRVRSVQVTLGALGHVDPDAVRFCFDAVARGTIVEGARLDIRTVPGQAWCLDCAKKIRIADRMAACPECGQHRLQVTGGNDLRLDELEVD